jgi:hypothetical protein
MKKLIRPILTICMIAGLLLLGACVDYEGRVTAADYDIEEDSLVYEDYDYDLNYDTYEEEEEDSLVVEIAYVTDTSRILQRAALTLELDFDRQIDGFIQTWRSRGHEYATHENFDIIFYSIYDLLTYEELEILLAYFYPTQDDRHWLNSAEELLNDYWIEFASPHLIYRLGTRELEQPALPGNIFDIWNQHIEENYPPEDMSPLAVMLRLSYPWNMHRTMLTSGYTNADS